VRIQPVVWWAETANIYIYIYLLKHRQTTVFLILNVLKSEIIENVILTQENELNYY